MRGAFPEARWNSRECRAVLHFRKALSYQELSERLGFLHQLEVDRREKLIESIPGDVLAVSHALLRYMCDMVTPSMTPLESEPERDKTDGLWQIFGFSDKKNEKAKSVDLSSDELMSIQSKLRRCFWLAPLTAPSGWPGPWKATSCGLCSAEEVG